MIGNTIGDHAVDFFQHRPVATPDACLHMSYLHPTFARRDSAGHGADNIFLSQC